MKFLLLSIQILSTLGGPILEFTVPPAFVSESEVTEPAGPEPQHWHGKLSVDENEHLQESCGKFDLSPSNRVQKAFGSDLAVRDSAPWVVAVTKIKEENGTDAIAAVCSGTLISSRHVLAAKHCQAIGNVPVGKFRFVFDNDCASQLVRFGEELRKPNCSIEGAIIRKAVKAFTPKDEMIWNNPGILDLLVFELNEPVPFMDNLYPACLAGSLPEVLDVLQLFSFGRDELSEFKKGSLQKISMTVIPCLENNRYRRGVDTFCTGSIHQHTDHGDSGGGFILFGEDNRHSVVGVVSGGWNMTSNYMVYAQNAVAPHLDWICEHAGICVWTTVTQLNPVIDVLHA